MPTDTRTPDEIERDIERERAELSQTVDALQDKFSPENIFREVTRGFREHGGDFGTAVTRSAKQNPVALALTGVGLAWLMFGRSHDEPSNDDRPRRTQLTERDAAYGHIPRRTQSDYADDPDFYAPAGSYQGDTRYSGRRYASYPDWAREEMETNPYRDVDQNGPGVRDRVSGAASSAGDSVRRGAGSVASGASSAGSSIASGASSAGSAISSGAKSAGSGVAGAARSVGSGISSAASSTADGASRFGSSIARGTESMTETARERVIAARERAMDMAYRADSSARRTYARGRDAAGDFIEEQPLVAGALAMAVGAALAGALPRTRQEDELLGQTRDDLFDEAERIYHEERHKAERVAQAALDEASNIAKEKRSEADSSAPGSKSAVEAAADEVRDAGKRVEDAAKKEAERQDLGNPKV